MTLTLSSVYTITLEQLQKDFANGDRVFTKPERYIRGVINDADVEAKKEALLFSSPEGDYIEIIAPLLFFKNEEGKAELNQGNNRVRALFEMASEPKHKDKIFRSIPFQVIEEGWTIDDLYTLQVALNDNTTKHKIPQLARILLARKNQLIDEIGEKMKSREKAAKITAQLKQVFQINSDQQLSRLIMLASQPAFVQDLLDKELVTMTDIATVNQFAPKVNKSTEELFKELASKVPENEKIPSTLIQQYCNINPTTRKTETSGSSKSSTNTTGSTGLSNEEKTLAPLSEIDFTQKVSTLNDMFTALQSVPDDKKNTEQISKIGKTALKSVLSIIDILGDEELNELFPAFFSLSTFVFGDPAKLASRAKVTDKQLNELFVGIRPLEKSVSALYESVFNPKEKKDVANETSTAIQTKPNKAKKEVKADGEALLSTVNMEDETGIVEGVTEPKEVTVGDYVATV